MKKWGGGGAEGEGGQFLLDILLDASLKFSILFITLYYTHENSQFWVDLCCIETANQVQCRKTWLDIACDSTDDTAKKTTSLQSVNSQPPPAPNMWTLSH